MATAPHFVRLIQVLRRILSKSVRGRSLVPALKQLWGYFALYISRLRLLLVPSSLREHTNRLPRSSLPKKPAQSFIGRSDGRCHEKEPPNLSTALLPCTFKTIENGETISLDGAVPSIYPLSGSGIHNSSRGSMILEDSRSAHSRNIASASRSNIDGNSQRSPSVISSAPLGFDEGITITVQRDSPVIPPQAFPSDIPHSSYLHPGDISSRPQSPNALGLSNSSKSSLASNEEHHRSSSPGLYNQSPGMASSRSSIATSNNGRQTSGIVDSPYLNPNHSNVSIIRENGVERTIISPSATEVGESVQPPPPLASERIVPIMPEGLEPIRYLNRPTTQKEIKCFETPPCSLQAHDVNPDGWVKFTHPEGVRYFYHIEKHVYTDSNICDERIYHDLMGDIDTILRHRIEWVVNLPDVDLVINTRYCEEDPTRTFSAYYFISHSYFHVFFVDYYKMDSLCVNQQVYGPTSWDHLGHEIEAQYWYHVQLYPHSRSLTGDTIAQLRDVVLHFIGDTMTSPTSTAPYSMQDLRDILALTKDMESKSNCSSQLITCGLELFKFRLGNLLHPRACVGTQSLLARQMFIFCRAKYLHFHGEPHARVERDVSVYGDIYKRTWLVTYLSPILFFAPDFHLKNLQSMWVDRIMHKSVFREAMKKMNEEWDRYVLFATVMLSANVGFLAIQSVDNDTSPHRSAAQIASYVSMLASIGSIVLGLHLSRQNKTKDRDNIDNITEVQQYMERHSQSTFGGLEVLATLYSLPYALLIWGMVSYFVAVSLVCFLNSDTPTRSIVGFCVFSLLFLVYCCIYINWDKEEAKCNQAASIRRPENVSATPSASSSTSSVNKTTHSQSYMIDMTRLRRQSTSEAINV